MRFPKTVALGAGGLSALGFAPLGWWPITLICFALLIHLVSEAPSWKSAAGRGYWFGVGHFTVGLNWIAGAFQYQDTMPHWLGWFAVVGLALYIGVYPAMAAGVARWLSETVPSGTVPNGTADTLNRGQSLKGQSPISFIPIFAAAWIVSEYLRAVVFTGFAWNPLGAVLIDIPLVRELPKAVGTYGLSAWAIIVPGLAASYFRWWVRGIREHWQEGTWLTYALGPLLLGFGWILVGADHFLRLVGENNFAGLEHVSVNAPLIRIVQPNIGQQDKHNDAFDAINFAKLSSLTGKPGPEPRLILWPEAAVPDYIGQGDAEALAAREKLAALIGPKDVLLTGAVKLEEKRTRRGNYIETELVGARNAMFVLDGQGRILGRYDKSHLVPYGEYLPMAPLLSAVGLSRLVPGTVDFWPGPGPQSYSVPGFGKMGVQICYEIIFSGQVVDEAHRPDFLFNPSNDAWFGSWGPPQHLAQARLRAIEEGLPIIRSTPTGISAVIDADGNILHRLPFQKAGYIEARLPPPHAPTLFSRYGNPLSLAFAALLFGLGIALRTFRR